MSNPMNPLPARRRLTTWGRAAWLLTAAVALIAGCGGVDSGGTGTYASGPITGFGSIIVNGVRFDESTAAVLDDDDTSRQRSELRIGMTVEVDGDAIRSSTSGRSAVASRVRFGSAIVGPVTAIDVVAGRFTALGQTVVVAVDTVFDERLSGGLAGLAVGQGLEIYALFDAANARYAATRIEPSSAPPQGLLRGPVAALDKNARSLRIGNATFNYAATAAVPADLAVGSIVRLRLNTVPDANGRYAVTSFGTAVRRPDDRDDAELEGLVTAYTSGAAFQVNGLAVDASAASVSPGGATVRLGARVTVKGTVRGGVLVATRVDLQSDQNVEDRGFELSGAITAVNAAGRTFIVRGQAVSWSRSDLRLKDGTLASIVVGRKVEVKARLAADRTLLEATEIRFND